MENSDYIWENYANGSERRKIGIVFNFEKLRTMLNQAFSEVICECDGIKCHQIFNINYGILNYVDWGIHQANKERLPNPIGYTYLKSNTFVEENDYVNEKNKSPFNFIPITKTFIISGCFIIFSVTVTNIANIFLSIIELVFGILWNLAKRKGGKS